jgi:hypothetical protein
MKMFGRKEDEGNEQGRTSSFVQVTYCCTIIKCRSVLWDRNLASIGENKECAHNFGGDTFIRKTMNEMGA